MHPRFVDPASPVQCWEEGASEQVQLSYVFCVLRRIHELVLHTACVRSWRSSM